jgi:hypothetical protein
MLFAGITQYTVKNQNIMRIVPNKRKNLRLVPLLRGIHEII